MNTKQIANVVVGISGVALALYFANKATSKPFLNANLEKAVTWTIVAGSAISAFGFIKAKTPLLG